MRPLHFFYNVLRLLSLELAILQKGGVFARGAGAPNEAGDYLVIATDFWRAIECRAMVLFWRVRRVV
jgi:hypothetical protein